jgi:hypothetical protein
MVTLKGNNVTITMINNKANNKNDNDLRMLVNKPHD